MKIEAVNEEDQFAWILKFSEPTASQMAEFPNFPLARKSDNFVNLEPDQISSSPDATATLDNPIFMISPPGSSSSVDERMLEEDAEFLTPPEHHLPSSQEQNPNELWVEGPRVPDDEPEAKRVKVGAGEEFDSGTVPLDETEVAEPEGNENVHNAEVIVLGSEDSSGEERAHSNLAGMIGVVQEISSSKDDLVPKFDGVHGNHMSVGTTENLEDIRMDAVECELDDTVSAEITVLGTRYSGGEGRNPSNLAGKANTVCIVQEIGSLMDDSVAKFDSVDGNRESGVKIVNMDDVGVARDVKSNGNSDSIRTLGSGKKAGKTSKGEKMAEVSHRSGGARSSGKRIEEIEEFTYTGDLDGRCKNRTGRPVGSSGRMRQLPPSLNGIEKVKDKDEVETSEEKIGLPDLIDILEAALGDTGRGCKDVDIIGTAKSSGLTFPRPRWWPSHW